MRTSCNARRAANPAGEPRSRRSVWRASVLTSVCGFAFACGGSPAAPSAIASGVWGGQHVTLTIGDTTSHLEFDCAHGDIGRPFMVDAQSSFELAGTFVREHGGPVRDDEAPDLHPAVYRGSVKGDRMDLTVQLSDSSQVVGTFALIRGTPGQVVKCL